MGRLPWVCIKEEGRDLFLLLDEDEIVRGNIGGVQKDDHEVRRAAVDVSVNHRHRTADIAGARLPVNIEAQGILGAIDAVVDLVGQVASGLIGIRALEGEAWPRPERSIKSLPSKHRNR